MAEAVKLVTKPTILEEVKAEIVELLEDILRQAKAGDLANILIISKRSDQHWQYDHSTDINFPETMGHLEITKTALMRKYDEAHH